MPLSNRAFFGLLDDTNPRGEDSRTISDDQHREILASMKEQCPNWTGVVTATHADVNGLTGLAAGGTKPMPGVGGQTVVYFYLATPPPGYTPVNPDANVRTLMVGGTGGTIAGSEDPSAQPVNTAVTVTVTMPANTGGYTLQEEDIPTHNHGSAGNHRHKAIVGASGGGPPFNYSSLNITGNGDVEGAGSVGDATENTGAHIHPNFGGGGPHSHPIGGTTPGTGSGTATLAPRYAMGVLGQLDA